MALDFEPASVIVANLGLEPNGRVHKYFTHRCRVHMDKYVPYDEGHLRTEDVTEGINYIEYGQPYAHYMYEGVLYVDPETGSSWARKNVTKVPTGKQLEYHTAGTGDHWDNRMWSAEQKQVVKEVQDYIRRN